MEEESIIKVSLDHLPPGRGRARVLSGFPFMGRSPEMPDILVID